MENNYWRSLYTPPPLLLLIGGVSVATWWALPSAPVEVESKAPSPVAEISLEPPAKTSVALAVTPDNVIYRMSCAEVPAAVATIAGLEPKAYANFTKSLRQAALERALPRLRARAGDPRRSRLKPRRSAASFPGSGRRFRLSPASRRGAPSPLFCDRRVGQGQAASGPIVSRCGDSARGSQLALP